MSLTVPPQILQQAKFGEVDDAAFIDCIRTSLPYAWTVITGLVDDLPGSGGEFNGNPFLHRMRPPAGSCCA